MYILSIIEVLYIVDPKATCHITRQKAPMHAPGFGTQSKQSSKQLDYPYLVLINLMFFLIYPVWEFQWFLTNYICINVLFYNVCALNHSTALQSVLLNIQYCWFILTHFLYRYSIVLILEVMAAFGSDGLHSWQNFELLLCMCQQKWLS